MSDIDTGMHYPVAIRSLPPSWRVVYAGEACDEVRAGFACGRHSRDDIGICHLRPMNISKYGKIDLREVKFVDANTDARRLVKSDVLFNNTNSPELIGKTALATSSAEGLAFSNHMTRLRFNEAVTPEFGSYQLHYFWMAGYFLHKCVKHVNQASISSRDFARTIPIVLAPLVEQRRITRRIDELFSELDEGIEKLKLARAQIANCRRAVLREALQGRLTEQWREDNKGRWETSDQLLFRIKQKQVASSAQQLRAWAASVDSWRGAGRSGRRPTKPSKLKPSERIVHDELTDLPDLPQSWQYVRLSEIARIGSGMSVSRNRNLTDPIEVPYLSVANVQRGRLDLSRVKTMRIERAQLASLELEYGDVLFNEGGDRDKLGRGWVWGSQIEPCITQNHVFRASPFLDSYEHSKWISHWSNSFGQRYFEVQGKQTTNLASINKTVLSRFPIPLPPIIEQVEILRRIDVETATLDSLAANIATALRKAESLRRSILKRAFDGKLVPQDPHDEPASVVLDRNRSKRAHVAEHTTRRAGKPRSARARG